MRSLFLKYPKLKRIRKVCFITTVRFDLAPRAIRECRALSEKYSIEVIEFDSSKSLPKSAINGKVIFKRVRPKFWPKSRLLKFFFLMSAMIPEVIRSQAEVYH